MKVTIVNNNKGGGDWEGLYIDGKLFMQGHSLLPEDILNALNIPFEKRSFTDEEIELMDYNFPENESDLI